jgi:hypothetical protein
MTIQEYTDRLQQLYGLVGTLEEYTLVPAGAEMLAAIKQRVLKQGIGTDGNTIGSYSTKPIYASKNQFVKGGAFQAKGVTNNIGDRLIPTQRTKTNSRKKNPVKYSAYTIARPDYKPRKSMYLPQGYKELREIQGLNVAYMDLSYSGRMVRDYQMQQVANAVLLGITTDRSSKIYQGLSNRFGEFYQPSTAETKLFFDATAFRLQRLIRGTIDGVTVTPEITIMPVQ